MATTRTTSKQPITRGTRKSVPQSGSKPVTRQSVGGRNAGGRTAAKTSPPRKATLPTLQPTIAPERDESGEPTRVATPTDRYPRVDPAVLSSAFARAIKSGAPENTQWDASHQQWVVPSATRNGRSYRIWRRRGRKGPLPFYIALECNCQAEQSGSYAVCWHKCAVKLWLNEWFADNRFGDALDALS